ncbi:MAG TPA: hypothetical protein VH682_25815 [Gemmataceae bacterium]
MHSPTAATVPPPPPRPPRRTQLPPCLSWIALLTLILAGGLLLAEYLWLRARHTAQTLAQANERVGDEIETARAHLAVQHWDEAVRHLEDALAVDRATNRAEVRPLLDEARRGQADALLEAAGLAVAHKDSAGALRLLHAYLAHPHAKDPERARLLSDDLARATSDDEAARLLARLSDDALNLFEKRGQLVEEDGIHLASARTIFKDTLRRNLTRELQRREVRREVERLTAERRAAERARRIARLRDTPVFRELSAFIAQTLEQSRDRQELARRQEVDLGQLFQQLGVNDPAEQAQIRADLMGREERSGITASVERKRAEIKRAYRASPEFREADGELFDRQVDQELDKLLKMLPSS